MHAASVFTFERASLDENGQIELAYLMPSGQRLVESIAIPLAAPLTQEKVERLLPLVRLLHFVAGVSYFKADVADELVFTDVTPTIAQAEFLAAHYSEGLGEFAYVNDLPDLPRPRIVGEPSAPVATVPRQGETSLVAVGGGKDSIVALQAALATEHPAELFSVGTALPIARCAEVAGLPWHHATRRLDAELFALNEAGATNGHIPITAIVSLIAAITAEANGFARVLMANERSASAGNVERYGIDVNHQWSKGLPAERLLRAAIADTGAAVDYFSVLRGASELQIARAFAGLTQYHRAFQSCNVAFHIDESKRASWCGRCPKCRFVFLVLAPFMEPAALIEIFGRNLLDEADQYEEFARLASVGGFKPFECVGEVDEAVTAFRLLAADPHWRESAVVARFAEEVPVAREPVDVATTREFVWSTDHEIPEEFEVAARAVLGA
jgi:hypothetical protein